MRKVFLAIALILVSTAAWSAETLRVVSAGPVGQTAVRSEANEMRVVFSEPMVVLGRIPNPVTAPWFRMDPAVKGTFRWSGTTTLIFTPDPPLPFATRYTVTIDKSAKSVAGNTLESPTVFTFTTPTIKLLSTEFYRRGGKADGSVVIAMRFNQPVKADAILPHLRVRTVAHDVQPPFWTSDGIARLKKLEPQGWAAYEAKKTKVDQVAKTDKAPVLVFAATDWDKERWPVGNDLVVVETKPGIAPETHLDVVLDASLTRVTGEAGNEQSNRIELDPALFVSGIECTEDCNPEGHNPISFRTNWSTGISFEAMKKAITITDITDPAKETVVKPKPVKREEDYPSAAFSLDELGYTLIPAHKLAVRIDPSLKAEDGQTLGYTWMTIIDYTHRSAFVSFGDGHGVWEASGGSLLPFSSRNFKTVTQWLAPFSIEGALPILQKMKTDGFITAPPDAKPEKRTIKVTPDRIQFLGFDLKPAIGADNLGLAWVAVQPGEAIADAPIYNADIRASLIQSTNLGISVKDSPLNTLVLVTRLDNAQPVEGAKVTIRDRDNKVFWTGPTDAQGLAIVTNTDLRRTKGLDDPWEMSWRALNDLNFLVTAEKDGDVAFVGSDWHEGVLPWEFSTNYDINEADPLLRGAIFTDRGVYKLGEEIHFKLIARSDTPKGMQLLPAGTKIDVTLYDSQNKELDKRSVSLGAWSSGEWTFRVPQDVPLGDYYVTATWQDHVVFRHDFLVAAYRRPEFRVDTTLASNSTVAGTKLTGTITGKYLFGAPMPNAPLTWNYTKQLADDVPAKITDRWPLERWAFLGTEEADNLDRSVIKVQEKETKLSAKGDVKLTLETQKDAGWPYVYRLEGIVTDVTRQQIAGRTAFRVDPTPWYIGVKTPPYFAEAEKGVDTEIVAAGLDGLAVAGVEVKVELKRLQWTSTRAAEGDGFYGWDSEQKKIDAGSWTVKTSGTPAPLHIPLTEGGEYLLIATATDAQGRSTSTRTWFYAIGSGYTAWPRYDHNRIDLIPEKQTYKPGDTARIMIKSPWETATALLTTEREGVRTWKPFELTSSQQTISVPITEKDIPNVFVSVLLVKGRTKQDAGRDGSDPGKPAFRLGYVELNVEDAAKRLKVDVKANREEFRPASKATINVDVRDAKGQPAQAEVTLWAVDYGVLSLTDFQTPDILGSIWIKKALQVANEDSRQRIVSRRVLTPKGATDGGGGGKDSGPGAMRKDFRVLAFWLGSLTTDKNGKAKAEVTLPESLTTYRVMAVAGDKQSRFGWAQNELRINQPLMVTPSWPRFLSAGDKAHFGGVVHNQKTAGKATVTITSLDPDVISFTGAETQTITIPAGGSTEVRWDAVAKGVGASRIQLRVSMGAERDAFEDTIPVRILVTPETVAAYGEAKPKAQETLEIPSGIVPGFGGLHMQLSSTMMVGLAEGASYLVQYPYGCAEQRASGALALVLTSSLGDAFEIPGIDTAKNKPIAQETLTELRRYQCGGGGFAYWPGDCDFTSPYLTSYVVHVLQQGRKHGYKVDASMLTSAYEYLERELGQPKPANEGWMPSYTAWQAFTVKALADGGRNVDSHVNRLYEYRDRMPIFAISYLLDTMITKGEKGARPTELRRRITNSILPEGGNAFVNELNDPYLLWFWNSNVRSTAIALGTLVRNGSDEELVKRMVRWLMNVRKKGRWGNTQENAWAMESLIDYYRKYESEVPDFTGLVALGQETIAKETFKGRTTDARTKDFSMKDVLAKGPAGTKLPVVFTREGTGTLFYMLRFRYGLVPSDLKPIDSGFKVERAYAVEGSGKPQTAFKAGDLIRVTLKFRNTKERRFVAVTDPIPAGTEPVDTWFATTATELVNAQQQNISSGSWMWWQRGGWDHVERHDDRVNVFATRLSEGEHVFSYLVRATTAGTFITAPTHAEEMYEPEVFGRAGTVVVEVAK